MSKKSGLTESQGQKLAGVGLKKEAKRPQVFMIGDGFPVELKNAFDILSPHPISGIRVPIQQLFQEIHKMALGTSRLGPMTAEQFKNDLKAPYATIASNALLMGMILTFAQMERSRIVAFSFNRSKFLKALMRYFELERIDGLGGIFSSGRIPEPPDFAIPYSPEKYQPEKLTQMTQSLAKWTETTRETLVRHQKEWETFDRDSAPIVSERMLRASTASKELDETIERLRAHPRVLREPELLEVSRTIEKVKEDIYKKNDEEVKSIKPLTEKEIEMIEKSHVEAKDETPKDFKGKQAGMAELKSLFTTVKSEVKIEELAKSIKSIEENMNNDSVSKDVIIKQSEAIRDNRNNKGVDLSTKMGVMAGKSKELAKEKKVVRTEKNDKQKIEMEELRLQGANLFENLKKVEQKVSSNPLVEK